MIFLRKIFLQKNTDIVCVDYFGFEMHIAPGLERFLKKQGEESFIIAFFVDGELQYCYEYSLADEGKKRREPDHLYSNFTRHVDHLELVYYTQKCDWLAWFSSACEFGIFAFENELLIKNFIKEIDRRDLFTPNEIVNDLLSQPKKKFIKKFLKLYEPMAYPLEEYIEEDS